MTPAELLADLNSKGVTLVVDGDKLKCKGKQSVLTPELLDALRQHKVEIIGLIGQGKASVEDGQLPPLDRPPASRTELRRLIDYLDDPMKFAMWFEKLMRDN